MSKNLLNMVAVDTDQQKGSLDKNGRLEDYQRSAIINASSGLKFHLTVVADGGGKNRPDQTAELAVDTIFKECKNSNEKSLNEVLLAALSMANQVVYQQHRGEDYVGVTVVAVREDRLYLGQVGQLTRAYLIPNNKPVVPFNSGNEKCLGDSPEQPAVHIEQIPGTIKQGDRIVICSDGLFDPPGDEVVKKEVAGKVKEGMPVVGNYDDIRGSARHLSSIAKGLDAKDDITVVVLGIGRKPGKSSRTLLLVSALGIVVVLIVLAVVFHQPNQPPRPQDFGLAVLVSGDAGGVDPQTGSSIPIQQLSIINPGITLIVPPGSSANLKLKKRTDAQSTNTAIIQGVDFYLSEQTKIILTTLDLAPTVDNSPSDPGYLNLTEITLINGKVLIRSDSGRNYVILIPAQQIDKNAQVVLAGGGKGILGVTEEGTSVEAYCLQGSCQFIPPSGEAVPLSAPGKTGIDMTTASVTSANAPITDADWKLWNSLCSGSQAGSCDLSK